MSTGFIKKQGSSLTFNKLVVRITLLLSSLAAIGIALIILTVLSSNRLMSVKGSEISNVPSNVLPSYSTVSFESFDGQTNLSGWFFNCGDSNPISTIIVVNDSSSNRLQFGVEMIDLVEQFLSSKYNVFLFDLRNCGESGGDITGYGYLEWQDVLGAISQVKKISVTTDVILYGIGTGCSASIIAYDKLPLANSSETDLLEYSDRILDLGFDRGYIKGMILDSPAKNSDDYIRPYVSQNEFLGQLTQFFVPYAIRVSAEEPSSINLVAEISRIPVPVCILYGGHDSFIGADRIEQLVNERYALNANITMDVMIPGAGYLESYTTSPEVYSDVIMQYLSDYFG